MARAATSRRRLAVVFSRDPVAAVSKVLESAGTALARGAILQRLVEGGVEATEAARVWATVRTQLKADSHVIVEGTRYRWSAGGGHEPTAAEAVDLLITGGLPEHRRLALASLVKAALGGEADPEQAARNRRTEIDAMRAMAELAGEVEELAVNEASPTALVHRVRTRMARSNLEPVSRAGADQLFDRRRHRPIGGGIRDGTPVVVVRPGYVWRSGSGDVLVAEVLVEE